MCCRFCNAPCGDTYEVSIEQSGDSQSCNVYWNELVAQRFFDVDAVLFGGGLGNSNTALTLVSIIIFLFIAIMFVLIRRVRGDPDDDDYDWEDEFSDDDSEDNVESEVNEGHEQIGNEESVATTEVEQSVTETVEVTESAEDLRTKLAAKARKTGVMQAAPGTEQGKTGWYVDSTGQLTSWLVSEEGEWTRVS